MVNFDQIFGIRLGHPTGHGTILGWSRRRRDLRRLRQAHHGAAVDHGRHRLDAQRQKARSVSRQVFPVLGIRRGAHRRRRFHGVGSIPGSPSRSTGLAWFAEKGW